MTGSQGFSLTKLMAVNTGLAPPVIDKLQFLSFITGGALAPALC